MNHHLMMMSLEGKGRGIAAITRDVITAGMHLMVTVLAVSPHMRGSDPARRRATVDWMRMRDMVQREQSIPGRRAGGIRGAKKGVLKR
jgi:hypothetical protein